MENSNPDQLLKLRHSAEHILTMAMRKFFPRMKMAMGPAIETGFYFDVDLGDEKVSEEMFPQIEKEMWRIVNQKYDFVREEVPAQEARKLFADNEYKQEWVNEIEKRNEPASIYWTAKGTADEFVDLCAGPHVDSTNQIGQFKLLSVAGAYWHGDEKNKMLTRIYGTAFPTKEELDAYIHQQEEAKRRDHRKLGQELDLFTFSELIGSGMPLYTPKGAFIRRTLNEYVEQVQSQQDYTQVWTPQIAKAKLFQVSGHYDKYKDDMFRIVSNYSDEEFYLKPMNCPQHTQIYASQARSYRDLPLRYTDFAMLYRDEKPGELNGLARVRSFSQDDCHIFCREDQVDEEIDKALSMTKEIMKTFGFTYRYRLSTRDPQNKEKYLGNPATWDKVEEWAVKIMQRNQIEYYDGPGEAAFYAPKMDLMATDALGREWQLSTVQIDYVMPERFDLKYVAQDGSFQRPVMLHRAIIGSPERFIMILLEHFAGAFPVWLSPVQTVVVPISEKHADYATSITGQLKEQGVRVELDNSPESMQKRIRSAEKQKVPYMLVVGDREQAEDTVAVRARGRQDLGAMKFDEFAKRIKVEIHNKSL